MIATWADSTFSTIRLAQDVYTKASLLCDDSTICIHMFSTKQKGQLI